MAHARGKRPERILTREREPFAEREPGTIHRLYDRPVSRPRVTQRLMMAVFDAEIARNSADLVVFQIARRMSETRVTDNVTRGDPWMRVSNPGIYLGGRPGFRRWTYLVRSETDHADRTKAGEARMGTGTSQHRRRQNPPH